MHLNLKDTQIDHLFICSIKQLSQFFLNFVKRLRPTWQYIIFMIIKLPFTLKVQHSFSVRTLRIQKIYYNSKEKILSKKWEHWKYRSLEKLFFSLLPFKNSGMWWVKLTEWPYMPCCTSQHYLPFLTYLLTVSLWNEYSLRRVVFHTF